jgi:hypothetical protein
MRSDLQIEASRANGSKSRGPVTEEGKLASSRNALKHGMLSQYILIPGESADAFHALAADLFAEFRPLGSTEEDLVEMMVAARWRRSRIWSMEKTCFTKRMAKEYCEAVEPLPNAEETAGLAFAALANQTRTLDLVNRYESRYDRQYFRAHRRLLDIQDRRTRNEPDDTPPPAPGPVPASPSATTDPTAAPDDPTVEPIAPSVNAGNSSSFAKRTQANVENTEPTEPPVRLPHWHKAFTPVENIANSRSPQPLQPIAPENATVFHASSGIEQS